jgi:putative acetyltransferase
MTEIREEQPSDLEPIRAVVLAAFAPREQEANLVDLLRARGKASVSLVALGGHAVVGHVLFSPVTIESGAGLRGVGMAPVSVLPAHQARGIGSALIRRGLEVCRARGFDFAVVLGNPRYYARFGFDTASKHGLANEYGMDEPFRVQALRAGGLDGARGVVRYAPEFAETGT